MVTSKSYHPVLESFLKPKARIPGKGFGTKDLYLPLPYHVLTTEECGPF